MEFGFLILVYQVRIQYHRQERVKSYKNDTGDDKMEAISHCVGKNNISIIALLLVFFVKSLKEDETVGLIDISIESLLAILFLSN